MNASSPPRRPDGLDVRRAQRWFWSLTVVAVLAMGALYQGLRSAPGPGTGVLVLVSALVLAASAVQAARILTVLTGPPRLPRHLRLRPPGRRTTAVHTSAARPPKEE
ncbi:hypothetical protein GCM10011579_075400 [Streptomyces albiflavescens]|uniref:Uncharacterized protein n=1 Tax=Streptomyces albiflavescens TaxID=1623582 RepID=A0A917YCC0_9ACTN|nr:hypothetical protein [Streptomyces albiflavescens]GGN84908.1 hypothetical protein GCM10011579_075400 [Streptomyces albiflavescens]